MQNTAYNVHAILAGQAPADGPVTVKGWVRTRRDSKAGISFVQLSDGSASIRVQVVAPNTLPNYADEVLKLTAGCAVEATGTSCRRRARARRSRCRRRAIKVIGWVDDPDTYPIQPKPHTMEFLREVAHLRPRTNIFGAVDPRAAHAGAGDPPLSSTSTASSGSTRRSSPPSDAEGAGADVPRLHAGPRQPAAHAGRQDRLRARTSSASEAFLTVSGQLNVEAYCLALSKVYTFGPTFRAENSNTSRHLAEFWMIEPEIAFADLADDADLAEGFLKYIFEAVLDERADDMAFFDERVEKGADRATGRHSSTSRVRAHGLHRGGRDPARSARQKFEFPVKWGIDLQTEHERYLTEKHVRQPGDRHELPEGHQGVLHAPERRRQDRRRDGRAGAGHRRDHRRQPARGAARRARRAHGPSADRKEHYVGTDADQPGRPVRDDRPPSGS